jgi:predicted amidohydrolase/ribosomal protein S18 acetylase RimI-like enzyme
MAIDVRGFERPLKVRPLAPADFEALVSLQLRCFPKMRPWDRAQFESQLSRFPEGQIAVEIDGRLVASSGGLILDYSEYTDWHDWLRISDDGYIRNHDPEGDTFYGIEIMVDPEFRGFRLARRLYDARKELCIDRNLARMIIGGRIPGYAAHRSLMSVQEYVRKVLSRNLYDPVLTTQLANGFQLRQLIPDYLPSDEDSAGFATCLEWPNLDHLPERSRRERRAVEPVRVSIVQYSMRPIKSFDEFATQSEFFVDAAGDARADFVLFPELFTLQLLSLVEGVERGRAARRLADFTPQYLELFSNLAVKYDVNIVGGSQFVTDGETLNNASFLFRRNGTLDKQLKVHVTPSERRWWGVQGGNTVEVFDTDCGPISILVCYDVEFPELCRIAVDRGAQLIFVPFNTNDRHGYLRVRYCAQARAIENQVYVATAGCVGNLPHVENADTHYAQSAIFTPSDIPFARDGIASECSPNCETVFTHDLDLELLRRERRSGSLRHWQDRRTDVYRLAYRRNGQLHEI